MSVRSFLPPCASRPRNIGTYVFTATRKKPFIIVIFAKKYLVQKLRGHLLASDATNYTPKDGYQRNQLKVGKPLIVATLTKNASFRSYGKFAYLLRAYIRNINMRRYITSARGHELSGRVRAHSYNYYSWAECAWVAK